MQVPHRDHRQFVGAEIIRLATTSRKLKEPTSINITQKYSCVPGGDPAAPHAFRADASKPRVVG